VVVVLVLLVVGVCANAGKVSITIVAAITAVFRYIAFSLTKLTK
jgi:hypothetical protein